MVNEKDIKMAAHSIYFKNADMPKETVIARGKVSYGEHDRVLISIPASHENIYEFWRVMDVYMVNHKKELEGKTIKIIIREVTDE